MCTYELKTYAQAHDCMLSRHEAALLIDYLNGCDYDLRLEGGILLRDDINDANHIKTESYSLFDTVNFALVSNSELLDWAENDDEGDNQQYITDLKAEQRELEGILAKITRKESRTPC